MDQGYNQQNQPHSHGEHEEIVEFHSEMPQVPDENIEFIADEKLEEEVVDEI